MTTITHYLEADHRYCDEQLAIAETCVARNGWSAARAAFLEFDRALNRHLDIEESVLFPAFEQAPGAPAGPTNMMRAEHQQIRAIADSMQEALLANDTDDFSALADFLHILMGQHNMKEESVLYPLADRFLAGTAGEVIAGMQNRHDRYGES
jgi:hemerythrin-like domain-containing protein